MEGIFTEPKIRLLCEYMKKPVGLDMEAPRFSWSIAENKVRVEAYRICMADKKEALEKDEAESLVWDSQWVKEQDAHGAVYGGKALSSGVTYYWKVMLCVAGEGEKEEWSSEIASFTMGLLAADPWIAGWIGGIRIDQTSYLYRKQWETGRHRSAERIIPAPEAAHFLPSRRSF